MDKKIFTAGVKATATDFNDLHENTEDALGLFVKAVASAGDTDYILFEDQPPDITGAGPYTITVPAQYIAISGVVAKLDEAVFSTSTFPNKVWFAISYAAVTDTRDTISAPGQTVTVESAASAVALLSPTQPATLPEYVLDDSDNPTAPFEYASYDGSRVLTPDPQNYTWVIAAGSVADHASDHQAGGGDVIPLPALDGETGLIDYASLVAAQAAVTDVAVAGGSPFLLASTEGAYDDDGNPKVVTLSISLNEDTFDVDDELGLNFPSGPLAGSSLQPARSDHKHTLASSPIVAYETSLTIAPGTALDESQVITLPTTAGTVLSVSIYWKPASAPDVTNYPLVAALPQAVQYGLSLYNVGSYGTLLTGRQVQVSFGAQGLCLLSPDDYASAVAAFGSVTWESASASQGRVPTSGILVVRVLALRDYVGALAV